MTRWLGLLLLSTAAPALAQRADENAVVQADDAFGKSVGDETVGLYGGSDVRGFSAFDAGNVRIEGLYFDQSGAFVDQVESSSTIRVGLTALGYPFPAPTGIVDLSLRRVSAKPVVSVRAGLGDFLSPSLSVDAALPLSATTGLNIGASAEHFEYHDNADLYFVRYGGVLRHKPADGVELTGFFSRYDYGDEEVGSTIFTAGSYLPPRIERRRFFGQRWADWSGHAQNFGALAKASLGNWDVAAGAFNSRFTNDTYAASFFLGVSPDGVGERRILAGVDQRFASTSGELRVSRDIRESNRLHRVIASLRGRRVESRYGGFDSVDLGAGTIGVPDFEPQPDFVFSETTVDRVRQDSAALGYELRWAGVGELNLGLTKTRYRKSVLEPGLPSQSRSDSPWLWNAAAALTLSKSMAVYAATTRGLEESGTAPTSAVNANEALPALRTRQVEAGFRAVLPGDLRLVAGLFDIRKPYFQIDVADGVYRVLGDVRHRGAELSLSGEPADGLNVVAGAVLLDPRVTGAAVEDGRLGVRPIGRTRTVLNLYLDYRPPSFDRLSIDFGLLYNGRRVARADNSLYLPARTTLDLGARYRFRIGAAPATLRVQVKNLTNRFGWRVFSSGGFSPNLKRRAVASITADF